MSIIFATKATLAAALSAVTISTVIAVKPSYAANLTIPIPVNQGTPGFNFTNGGTATPGSTNDFSSGFFSQAFGFINSGSSATSGNSPFLSNDFIQNKLKQVILSFDFFNASSDTLQLTVNKSGNSLLSQTLTDINDDGEKFALNITNLFKDNGAGDYSITYQLSGNDSNSIAGFNHVALGITIPEPNLVAGFLALGIGAAIKRKRKS